MSNEKRAERARKRLDLLCEVDDHISIQVAQNFDELSQAFHLTYRAYLDKGYTEQKLYKLRVNKHLLLPNSTTFVAKWREKVVGCVSLVSDEILGLPSSSIFDLSPLRKNYLRIVEATSLAIDPNFRNAKGALFFSILKYLFHFAKNYYNADILFAAVNPRQEDFYKNIMLFDSVDYLRTKATPHANGAPAVPLTLNLLMWKDQYYKTYEHREEKYNLYNHFFKKNESSHRYPPIEYYGAGYSLFTPQSLEYFLKRGTDILKNPKSKDFYIFSNLYLHSNYNSIFSRNLKNQQPKSRYLTSIPIYCRKNGSGVSSLAVNVSKDGLGIILNSKNKDINLEGFYTLELGPSIRSQIYVEPIWKSENKQGLRLAVKDHEWEKMLQFLEVSNCGGLPLTFKKKAA